MVSTDYVVGVRKDIVGPVVGGGIGDCNFFPGQVDSSKGSDDGKVWASYTKREVVFNDLGFLALGDRWGSVDYKSGGREGSDVAGFCCADLGHDYSGA